MLATVTAGLYISWNGLRLISAATRLQGIFFWDFFIYPLEGMIFLITGLQARSLFHRYESVSVSALLCGSAAIICAVVIVSRFVWMFPADLWPTLDFACPAQTRSVAAVAMGRRCCRSPACAVSFRSRRRSQSLSPRQSGAPFPHRDLILFLTFSVILVTLVGQGLMISVVARALGLAQAGERERGDNDAEEQLARRQAIDAAIARLGELQAERSLSDEVVAPLRIHHQDRLRQVDYRRDDEDSSYRARVTCTTNSSCR